MKEEIFLSGKNVGNYFLLKSLLKNSIIEILPNFGVLNQVCLFPSIALKKAIEPTKERHKPKVKDAGNKNEIFDNLFSL